MSTKPTVIDLFAGCGGLSLGFHSQGFETVLACDNWKPAIETFTANFPDVSVSNSSLADVSPEQLLDRLDEDAPDVVVGGPPCQGFSSAGGRRSGDARNTLVAKFSEFVLMLKPRLFVFENVEGFLTAESGQRVLELLDPLITAGYRIHLRKVNAANYGVPQLRKRVIAIGALGKDAPFPAATHRAFGAPGVHRVGRAILPFAPTLERGLTGLEESPTTEHVERAPSQLDLERVRALAPGMTMRNLPEHLQHASYQRRALRRVMDGTPSERRGGAPAGLRRLRPDEPSKAITGAAWRELIHPHRDRPLTLRECARLQTFPDTFVFVGTQADKATLIGNAVPVLMAARIAEAVKEWIAASQHEAAPLPGALLSFKPTTATAMSPALTALSEAIFRRYPTVVAQEALWS